MKLNELKISAGNYELNKFLYGGFEKDIISTVYGPAGSGKTNLCLLPAISQAKKGSKVIFIDTEGGFSIQRVRQLAGENYEQVLENILLLKATDFNEQIKIISNLLRDIKTKGQIGLIVVDGMTMLYRLELGDAIKDRDDEKIKNVNRELAKQMKILAEISRNHNIPVIVTNQTYVEFNRDRENNERVTHMVGGDILKYWSKCILELENEKGKRKMILRKHRSLPEKELSFMITNSGIKKRGWI